MKAFWEKSRMEYNKTRMKKIVPLMLALIVGAMLLVFAVIQAKKSVIPSACENGQPVVLSYCLDGDTAVFIENNEEVTPIEVDDLLDEIDNQNLHNEVEDNGKPVDIKDEVDEKNHEKEIDEPINSNIDNETDQEIDEIIGDGSDDMFDF